MRPRGRGSGQVPGAPAHLPARTQVSSSHLPGLRARGEDVFPGELGAGPRHGECARPRPRPGVAGSIRPEPAPCGRGPGVPVPGAPRPRGSRPESPPSGEGGGDVGDSQSWVAPHLGGRARSVGGPAWGPGIGVGGPPDRSLAPGNRSWEGRGTQPTGSGAEGRGGSGAWVPPCGGLVRPPAKRHALPSTPAAGPGSAPFVPGCSAGALHRACLVRPPPPPTPRRCIHLPEPRCFSRCQTRLVNSAKASEHEMFSKEWISEK